MINIAELPDLPVALKIKMEENPLNYSYYQVTPVSEEEKQQALAQGYNETDDLEQFYNILHRNSNEFVLEMEKWKAEPKNNGQLPSNVYNWGDKNFFEHVDTTDEALPEFPRFTGSLGELASVIAPDLPYEFKALAAITHWGLLRSGLDKLADEPHLQPRFYVCLHADPGRGKSGSIKEIREAMQSLSRYQSYACSSSVDSGPALIDEFSDITKASIDGKDKPARVLLDVDEMSDLFQKGRITPNGKNTLLDELIKLFEHNRTGNRSRRAGKTQVENAHLAILGGTQPPRYQNMWTGTGGATSGLQSRFVVIATNQGRIPVEQRQTNGQELAFVLQHLTEQAQLPGQIIEKSPEAKQMLITWWARQKQDGEAETRVPDIIKRLLIVLAVTNDTAVIDTDLMRQGIEFGEYIIAARKKFNPSDACNWVQSFENMIIEAYRKRRRAMTERDYLRIVHPERKPGGVEHYGRAWDSLFRRKVLVKDGETVTHKTAKYKVTI